MAVEDRDHVLGSSTAAVTLVEYGDYECPTCRRAFPMIQELLQLFRHDLRFVFRHFPQDELHPRAFGAAEAAEAAASQGKFWEMHGRLFQNQHSLTDADLTGYAETLGLDVDRFTRELEAGQHRARVEEDIAAGRASGVKRTPEFFINGMRYEGQADYESLRIALSEARRLAQGSR